MRDDVQQAVLKVLQRSQQGGPRDEFPRRGVGRRVTGDNPLQEFDMTRVYLTLAFLAVNVTTLFFLEGTSFYVSLAVLGTAVLIVWCILLNVIGGVYHMYINPCLHLWPSVTRCRLCQKRIFVWQAYERRKMKMSVTPGRCFVVASGSCLCHCKCKGHPEGQITIEIAEKKHEDHQRT